MKLLAIAGRKAVNIKRNKVKGRAYGTKSKSRFQVAVNVDNFRAIDTGHAFAVVRYSASSATL
jgi:hypothetical protein